VSQARDCTNSETANQLGDSRVPLDISSRAKKVSVVYRIREEAPLRVFKSGDSKVELPNRPEVFHRTEEILVIASNVIADSRTVEGLDPKAERTVESAARRTSTSFAKSS